MHTKYTCVSRAQNCVHLERNMTTNNNWIRFCALALPAALVLTTVTSAVAQQETVTTYNSSFSIASQSIDDHGRTVIVMQGAGDLPGVLTLVLSMAADGSVSSGEWALNVSYTAPLNPNAQPDYSLPDPDSPIGEQLIQKGTLSGTIASGSATIADGAVSAFTSLQLVITTGTLQFSAVTAGNGSAYGIHIDDRTTSAAYTSLTF
jgi:hypothetical protein